MYWRTTEEFAIYSRNWNLQMRPTEFKKVQSFFDCIIITSIIKKKEMRRNWLEFNELTATELWKYN